MVIVGGFNATIQFQNSDGEIAPDSQLTGSGDQDIFVARYSFGGFFAWARSAGGPGFDTVHGVAVDRVNGIYVTGGFQEELVFASPRQDVPDVVLTSSGDRDAFVARYNRGGDVRIDRDGDNVITPQRFGGSGSDEGTAIVVDSRQNFYARRAHLTSSRGALCAS